MLQKPVIVPDPYPGFQPAGLVFGAVLVVHQAGTSYRMISQSESSSVDRYGGQLPQSKSKQGDGCAYSVTCFTRPLPDCVRNTNGWVPSPQALARTLGWSVARLEAIQQAAAQGGRGN